MRRIVLVTGFGLFASAVGCGSANAGDGAGGASADDSVGTVAQAFTESTCGAAPPDVTQPGPDALSISRDGTYGHPQCANAYVIQVDSTKTTEGAYANYNGPVVPPTGPISGCNGMWVKMSLWKLNGSSFTKVADAPYVVGAPTPDGTACLPPTTYLQIPSAGEYKVISQAGFALSYQSVYAGLTPLDVHDMSAHDDRGYTGDGDWAPGLYKGECNSNGNNGTYITGVSRLSGGNQSTKKTFCSVYAPYASDTTLDITSRDDRRSTGSGDWDPTFIKGECPPGEMLTGLAQTPAGVLDKARCAPSGTGSESCRVVTLSNGDDRESLFGGDWSVGDAKAQCQDNLSATGVSKDHNGKIRSLLCCALEGHI